jgi:hypothetical protein
MAEKNKGSKESASELSAKIKEALSQFDELRGFL